MNSTLSLEFVELLKKSDATIEEVTLHESFSDAVDIEYIGLIEFFKLHALEILDLFLLENPSKSAIILYRTISTAEATMLIPFIRNNEFNKKLASVILDDNTNDIIMVRLARLIAQIFFKAAIEIPPKNILLSTILKAIHRLPISNLLDSLITSEQTSGATLIYFKTEKLNEKMHDILKNMIDKPSDSPENSLYFGRIDSQRLGLFQLIIKSCTNPSLMPIFKYDKLTSVVAAQPKNLPSYIKSVQWSAIKNTISPRSASNLRELIPLALELVRGIKDSDHIKSYHASALMVINNILLNDPQGTIDSISPIEQFLDDAINGVLKFPNSTNYHSAFRAFVDISLHAKGLAEVVCPKYMPIFIKYSSGRKNKVLAATFNDLALKMIDMGRQTPSIKESLRKVEDFPVFATGELLEYRNIILNNYGLDPPSRIYTFFAKFFE